MSRLLPVAASLGLALMLGGAAEAQSWEVTGLAGYTPSAGLDRRAPELDQLEVGGGFTWGAQVGRSFTPRWGAEVLWTRQRSGLDASTEGGTASLFTFSVGELHADAVYHVASSEARLRPFVFAGLGATFFSGGGLPSETKFSWGLGGGVKYAPWKTIGARAHLRYKPVVLNDEASGDFCDPFGFCQSRLNQFDLIAGILFRF